MLLRRWLKKRLALQIAECLVTSLFAFVGGIVVLAVTFFFTYVVVAAGMLGLSAFSQLFFGKALSLPPAYIFIICSLFLVLLFIENFRTSRDYLETYVLQNRVVPIGGLWGALISLLANPDATGKIVSDLLFAGLRVIIWCFSALRRALRLMRTNLKATSETLAILAQRLHRIPMDELQKLLSGRDPMEALLVLQEIDCVLFLVREPAGVILTQEAREELSHLPGMNNGFESVPADESFEPPPADEPMTTETVEGLEYYELLGVQPVASLAEIKAAYRTRIKQCHPDKFVGRGAEFRQLAEERAKALNEAYEILSAKHSADVGAN